MFRNYAIIISTICIRCLSPYLIDSTFAKSSSISSLFGSDTLESIKECAFLLKSDVDLYGLRLCDQHPLSLWFLEYLSYHPVLWSILFDLLTAFLLYKISGKMEAFFYLVHPFILVNGSDFVENSLEALRVFSISLAFYFDGISGIGFISLSFLEPWIAFVLCCFFRDIKSAIGIGVVVFCTILVDPSFSYYTMIFWHKPLRVSSSLWWMMDLMMLPSFESFYHLLRIILIPLHLPYLASVDKRKLLALCVLLGKSLSLQSCVFVIFLFFLLSKDKYQRGFLLLSHASLCLQPFMGWLWLSGAGGNFNFIFIFVIVTQLCLLKALVENPKIKQD